MQLFLFAQGLQSYIVYDCIHTAKEGKLSWTKFRTFTFVAPLSFWTLLAIPNSWSSSIFVADETNTTCVPLNSSWILSNSSNTSFTIPTLFFWINIFIKLTKCLLNLPFLTTSPITCPLSFSLINWSSKNAWTCSFLRIFKNLWTSFPSVLRELLHWAMSTSAAA